MLDGGGFTGFKAREERRNVVLQAQLLGGRGRRDACILNVSTRGLLVYSDAAASPGSYVEVRRGEQVIVARGAGATGSAPAASRSCRSATS